jgi:L-lactate utilization protein LutB
MLRDPSPHIFPCGSPKPKAARSSPQERGSEARQRLRTTGPHCGASALACLRIELRAQLTELRHEVLADRAGLCMMLDALSRHGAAAKQPAQSGMCCPTPSAIRVTPISNTKLRASIFNSWVSIHECTAVPGHSVKFCDTTVVRTDEADPMNTSQSRIQLGSKFDGKPGV